MLVHIYDLSDPDTGVIRYVGKSVKPKDRLSNHISESRRGSVLHSRRWIAGLLLRGVKPVLTILETVEQDAADESEKYWIATLRYLGFDLTNRTLGGDGQSPGYTPSLETRTKLSKAIKGRKHSAEVISNLKAASNTPEVREVRRKNTLKLMSDPARRAKAQYGRTGIPVSDETKAKISASWTPERKAAHAVEKSALPFDERWKAQLSAALKARWAKHRGEK